jgi:iron(III) transport system ATP-binding protein
MLAVERLSKRFRSAGTSVVAVDGVSLAVGAGELFTILGPSGCGKTTTLRCIAGLEDADAGEIRVGDRVLFSSARRIDLPASARGLGMVFQSYAIWPHMNVFDNAAFPLIVAPRRVRRSRSEIRERVLRVLVVTRLEDLAERPATELSGGQQQRLALARALVMEPPLLLLDEPLSNLDAKLREEMRFELKRVQHELGVTTVYVTHDQVEALAMSSSIAVMRDGRIEQVGRPREIYERPATEFVADFMGAANLISGEVVALGTDGRYTIATAAGPLRLLSAGTLAPGSPVTVALRPESVGIEANARGPGAAEAWIGTVLANAFLGDAVDHMVSVGGLELRVRGAPTLTLAPGASVTLTVPEQACLLVPRS